MAKRQTRRTISMQRRLFELATEAAQKRGISASGWLHGAAARQLELEGFTEIPPHSPSPPRDMKKKTRRKR